MSAMMESLLRASGDPERLADIARNDATEAFFDGVDLAYVRGGAQREADRIQRGIEAQAAQQVREGLMS